jgi:hypothetical protein
VDVPYRVLAGLGTLVQANPSCVVAARGLNLPNSIATLASRLVTWWPLGPLITALFVWGRACFAGPPQALPRPRLGLRG